MRLNKIVNENIKKAQRGCGWKKQQARKEVWSFRETYNKICALAQESWVKENMIKHRKERERH